MAALAAEIAALPGSPRLCVDQEGGPVDRFRDILGRSVSFFDAARAGLAERAGELAGESCRTFGFPVDLAPVVDRMIPGASEKFLAGRCAAGDPGEVAAAATAFLQGLHTAGVSGCLKHFPGLGRANLDTHQALPFLPEDPDEEARDLAPFAALFDLAGAVMVSHVAGPDGLPASLSRERATDLLRGTVGFTGPAFSDDLEMGALAAFGDLPDRCADALQAGCDLIFVCSQTLVYPDCVERVDRDVPPERRLEAAARLEGYLGRAEKRARLAEERRPRRTVAVLRDEIARLLEEAGRG
jgi:beta-N-acetylhexosaminidase